MSAGRLLCVLEVEIATLDEALERVRSYAGRHRVEHVNVYLYPPTGEWRIQVTYRDYSPPPADIT